jgi:hypothetical protein
MRVPEQSPAFVLAALIALGMGWLAVGCAAPSPIQVTWDQHEDLSQFRTWDWIEGDAVFVRSTLGADAEERAQLSSLVERALRERGLDHAPGSGDLRVAALMIGVRTYQLISRPRAMQTLYSHHHIGGFEVQGEDMERRTVDRCRVAIYLTGPRQERIIWQAVSEQRHSDGCARHLDDAVAELLERFPVQTGVREDSPPAS